MKKLILIIIFLVVGVLNASANECPVAVIEVRAANRGYVSHA